MVPLTYGELTVCRPAPHVLEVEPYSPQIPMLKSSPEAPLIVTVLSDKVLKEVIKLITRELQIKTSYHLQFVGLTIIKKPMNNICRPGGGEKGRLVR